MKQHLCRLTQCNKLWSDLHVLTFDAPGLASLFQPGQCALVRDPTTWDPYLRRTAWLYQVVGEQLSVLLRASDAAKLLARARVGDVLDLLAPIGRSLNLDPSARHVLFVGENDQATLLVPMMRQALSDRRSVVLWMRSSPGIDPLPAYLLPPEVEYRRESDVPDKDLVLWADYLIAAGGESFYRLIREQAQRARLRLEPGWASVLCDIPMPCGTGACYACTADVLHRPARVCIDGPFLDMSSVRT